uniref:Uncharacterized protein n=1 Tax=Ascaris lumbricoides TaxID=6252 RepID=A0A9J2Q8C4_ASCLU
MWLPQRERTSNTRYGAAVKRLSSSSLETSQLEHRMPTTNRHAYTHTHTQTHKQRNSRPPIWLIDAAGLRASWTVPHILPYYLHVFL